MQNLTQCNTPSVFKLSPLFLSFRTLEVTMTGKLIRGESSLFSKVKQLLHEKLESKQYQINVLLLFTFFFALAAFKLTLHHGQCV